MALTQDSTLGDLATTTPTANIGNVDNKAQIRAAIGAASATDFIAGAGALTGPAAPLTIGTAAGNATGDFETPAGAQAKVDLVKIYSILAVDNGGSGNVATLTSTAFERTVTPDNTVTIIDLPDGAEADVGRSLVINAVVGVSVVDENATVTTMATGQVCEFRATSWSGTYLNWSLVGADTNIYAKIADQTHTGAHTFSGKILLSDPYRTIGATGTLATTDSGRVVICDDATGSVLTIPDFGTTVTAGETFYLRRKGAGAISFSTTATINNDAIASVPVGGECALRYKGSNVFDFVAYGGGGSTGSSGFVALTPAEYAALVAASATDPTKIYVVTE